MRFVPTGINMLTGSIETNIVAGFHSTVGTVGLQRFSINAMVLMIWNQEALAALDVCNTSRPLITPTVSENGRDGHLVLASVWLSMVADMCFLIGTVSIPRFSLGKQGLLRVVFVDHAEEIGSLEDV
jgi:hypothetical protein